MSLPNGHPINDNLANDLVPASVDAPKIEVTFSIAPTR